jgi:chromosome segregation ATPase
MNPGVLIADTLGVLSILAIVAGGVRWMSRTLNRTREKEIDERLRVVLQRRAAEQQEGSPVEKELRRQLEELKQEFREARDLHRSEIAELREEHDREISKLTTEIDVLRGQLREAYRTRPNAG